MRELPLDQHTMFHDLADKCLTAEAPGSVYRRTRAGISYLYAKLDDGIGRTDKFLGRTDDPDAQRRAAKIEQARENARARQSTVRLLRSAGFPSPDSYAGRLLVAFAGAGLFEDGAVLVGTIAYVLLQPVLGVSLAAPTLMTQDIDLSTSNLKLASSGEVSILEMLARVDDSYVAVPTLDAAGWPWRYRNASGFLVDLLTATRTHTDGESLPLPKLKSGAAPLQYQKWLIADPIRTIALHGAGIVVRIPQPARFAVHKLILAQKRDAAHTAKRRKDLQQASGLIDALRLRDPYALEDALDDARRQGKKGWAEPIDRSLAEITQSTR